MYVQRMLSFQRHQPDQTKAKAAHVIKKEEGADNRRPCLHSWPGPNRVCAENYQTMFLQVEGDEIKAETLNYLVTLVLTYL